MTDTAAQTVNTGSSYYFLLSVLFSPRCYVIKTRNNIPAPLSLQNSYTKDKFP